jgi:hypothetical protein
MEEVEFNAVICKHAMDLGAVHEISNDQLKKLMDLRKKMNLPGRHPGIDYGDEPATTSCNCSKEELVEFCKNEQKPLLPFNAEALENGSYIDEYNNFYDQL